METPPHDMIPVANALTSALAKLDVETLREVGECLLMVAAQRKFDEVCPDPLDTAKTIAADHPHDQPPGPTPCVAHHAGAYWLWQGGPQAKNDPQRYDTRERAHAMLKAACEAQGVDLAGRFYVSPTPGVPLDQPAQGLPAGDTPQADAIEEVRALDEGPPPEYVTIEEAIEATDWLKRWRTDRDYKATRGRELVEVIGKRWQTMAITDTSSAGKDALTWLHTATGKGKTFLRGQLWTMSKRVADKTHGGMPLLEDLARGAVLVLAEGL